jgi:hypothetical protein
MGILFVLLANLICVKLNHLEDHAVSVTLFAHMGIPSRVKITLKKNLEITRKTISVVSTTLSLLRDL